MSTHTVSIVHGHEQNVYPHNVNCPRTQTKCLPTQCPLSTDTNKMSTHTVSIVHGHEQNVYPHNVHCPRTRTKCLPTQCPLSTDTNKMFTHTMSIVHGHEQNVYPHNVHALKVFLLHNIIINANPTVKKCPVINFLRICALL